jgi:FkbM family methyltransferase
MTRVIASLPDGSKFNFLVHSGFDRYISPRIRERGSWEPFETRIMYALLRPGDVFIDIGANIGWHTVMSGLRVGGAGRVFAFEPEGSNADLLERNVALNELKNVKVFRCALSERTGTSALVKSATNMGDHRIAAGSTGLTVPVDTLDHLVASGGVDLARARIVKIDTQGAEAMVLRGAQHTLARLSEQCALFIEFSPNLLRQQPHGSAEHFLSLLGTMARDIYVVNAHFRTIHPIRQNELHEFAAACAQASEDVGLDLILAPRQDAPLLQFRRLYAPLLKSRFLQNKIH